MLQVTFAEKCAWRAIYVAWIGADGVRNQFFHLGVDPTTDYGPKCFGGISNPFCRRGRFEFSVQWRFSLPHLRWKYPASPLRMWLYGLSSRFWHSIDGRF